VPLLINRVPVGILASLSRTRRAWSDEEIRSAKWLAVAAAIAIRNAQLYQEASSRLERMRRLTRLSQTITSSLDVQQVLGAVTEAAVDLLGGDLVRLWTVDDGGSARLAASHARESFAVSGPAPVLAPGTIAWVIDHRSNHYSPNLAEEPLETGAEQTASAGCTSQITAPLVVGDRALGALAVLTEAPHSWTQEEEELLELFAATAATSLENARLFAATRAQATALREKNAELDAFVYSVSHDLKAPLVTIQGMAGLLVEDCAPTLGHLGAHYVERIRSNIEQMERLIADLLALSRVGREGRTPEPVNLNECLDVVLAELAEPIRMRRVKVTCGDLATVWAVRTQIEQVVTNLVSNAVKYMGEAEAPMIEIGTREAGGFVECWVRDNGIGIPPAYHDKVFEIFQRLKEVEAEGTGVGLAIVRKIVEGVSGRVWVESEPGRGSTFHFTWPAPPGGSNGAA
jgi:signal transduction histidine kinase